MEQKNRHFGITKIIKFFQDAIKAFACSARVLKKSKKYLEMVSMQLQKNIWHEGILEEAKVPGIMDKLPEMFNEVRAICKIS